MKIGFDAKRAFSNTSGLGNYSRTVIEQLASKFPQHSYALFTPKLRKVFTFKTDVQQIISPQSFFYKKLHFLWRTGKIASLLEQNQIDLYHGLSHELPKNIHKTAVKSVLTIHDLIFMRFPELFKPLDVRIYTKKVQYAAQVADTIIAISEQTKADILQYLKVPESKIQVVYQSCNPQFYKSATQIEKDQVRAKYQLPEEYLLIVGTIEKRKNLLLLLQASKHLKLEIPIVVLGRQTAYFQEVAAYIQKEQMQGQVHFYHSADFADFPAIYQMAKLFVYPSIFEGFGIPIIEAINSKIPVITSKGSCFQETGGPNCLYADSGSVEELGAAIQEALSNDELRRTMVENSYQYVTKFNQEHVAQNLMNVYEATLSK